MKLLRGIGHPIPLNQGVVATIGNFDGVHLGHQDLLLSLKAEAEDLGLPLVVIVFEPQPREYFHQEQAPARLSSLREKLNALADCQVDYVYCIKFDKKVAQTRACDFVQDYLFNHLNVRYLLVGDDFRFGKEREGDVALLRALCSKFNCALQTHHDFKVANERVSSTKIRHALHAGDLNLAARFLGRTYSMCGRVIRGDGRGRQWGIPTANINLNRLALPLSGVYVVLVNRGGTIIHGVANIGKRPTISGTKNILEVHLFDFNEWIYGDLLQVLFLHKLREEVKFTTIDALIAQIHEDIHAAQAYFNVNTSSKLNDFAE